MNVEIGTEAAQFRLWELINWIFVALYVYLLHIIRQLQKHTIRVQGDECLT